MKQVDELIRGERAAVDSLNVVLDKVSDEVERRELSSIRQDHIQAVDKLMPFAKSDFKEDVQTSGPWGSFAEAFTGGASLFGDKATLQALKVGEGHGLNDYREAMDSDAIGAELKEIIRSELMPNQERHIKTIEGYLQ